MARTKTARTKKFDYSIVLVKEAVGGTRRMSRSGDVDAVDLRGARSELKKRFPGYEVEELKEVS
jgi:hypothetical protein